MEGGNRVYMGSSAIFVGWLSSFLAVRGQSCTAPYYTGREAGQHGSTGPRRTSHWSRRPTACAPASLRLLGAAHRWRSAFRRYRVMARLREYFDTDARALTVHKNW